MAPSKLMFFAGVLFSRLIAEIDLAVMRAMMQDFIVVFVLILKESAYF